MNSNIEKRLNNIITDLNKINKQSREELIEECIKVRLAELLFQYKESLDDAVERLENKNMINLLRRL